MESSPLHYLPQDTLHHIFSHLPLSQIILCRSVCKFFNQTLTSPSFLALISTRSPLHLIALRPSHHHQRQSFLNIFDPNLNQWLKFSLAFLPHKVPIPVASSNGLVYIWAESNDFGGKSLVVCNPLTRQFRVLPQLGSAWSRHGTVLVGKGKRVLVLTELAAIYFSGSGDSWFKFSSNLPSKPRSPILVSDSVFALCDVGSLWRSQWKLFTCTLTDLEKSRGWNRLEKHEWGDVFDILKRPRLIQGTSNRILMVGGLKSSFSLTASCSTILILRLDLDALEWEEAGRMPLDMYKCFQESSKFKVFGGEDRVCFSAKRVEGLAMWDCSSEAGKGEWKWIDGVPGNGDGLCRGFVFEAKLNAVP
ncbi:SKP1-interacting partner 15 [Ranunculus cassubicifolius]